MSAPNPPLNVQATAMSASSADGQAINATGLVMATWTPGSPSDSITSYTVTLSSGASYTLTAPPGALLPQAQVVFPGLTFGLAYTVQVTATNADGTSSPSTPSVAVTPTLMPGSTVSALGAIIAQMWTDYRGQGLNPIPVFRIGEQFLAETDAPPKIVFVPRQSEWSGPMMLSSWQRQIWDRRAHIDVFIWGAQYNTNDAQQDALNNYGQAEQLMHNLAASIHEIFYGTQIEEKDRWGKGSSANTTMGADLVLDIALLIPVQQYPVVQTPITQFNQTETISVPT